MEQSRDITELAGALAKAQGAIQPAKKDSQNPFFHSTYADLASVWEACRKPLSDNGLSVTQLVSQEGDKQILETVLLHASGQYLSSTLVLTPKDDSPQAVGSAITYARRYALAAIVGVSSDDDDGESASGRPHEPVRPVQQSKAPIDTQSPYYCAKHNALWFKGGKMKAYAHPIEGSSEWCSMPSDAASAVKSGQGTVQAPKAVSEQVKSGDSPFPVEEMLARICEKKKFGSHATARKWLLDQCGITEDMLEKDPEEAWNTVRAMMHWE